VGVVARQLGNTPAVCRKAYIHPVVLSLCDTLGDDARSTALLRQPWARRPGAADGLKVAERRLLALLRGRARPPSACTSLPRETGSTPTASRSAP
jgi:DNA topoisomerase-1